MKLEKYTKQTGAFLRSKYREIPTDEISHFKGQRSINVDAIVVNVTLESGSSYNFQGDETSQNRLARSGWGMEKMNIETINWKTADNELVQLTVTDIATILLTAGQAQTELWF